MPAENTGNFPDGPQENIPFTVQGPPAVDNGRLTVHVEWGNPDTDWDVYVTDSTGEVVTQSASFGDTNEDAVLVDPPPGNYVAHVVNFDQVDGQPVDDWKAGEVRFRSPTPRVVNNVKEAWNLTCEDTRGPAACLPPGDRGPGPAGERRRRVPALGRVRRQAPGLTEERKAHTWARPDSGRAREGSISSHRGRPGEASAVTIAGAPIRRLDMMRSRRLAGTGAAIVAVMLTGCGGDDNNDTKSSAADTTPPPTATQQETVPAVVKVSIGDNFYKPTAVTIRRGQSISWRNGGLWVTPSPPTRTASRSSTRGR